MIIKNVKQYSYKVNESDLIQLKFIAEQYRHIKNYVYSRFSGINSIVLINNDRTIRDEWVKTKFAEQWKLPARYWKLALSEAISNIKTEWSNTKKRIRLQARAHDKLTNEDRYYINYVLKINNLYYNVLNNKKYEMPDIFKNKNLNIKYLNNLIKRYTRKYKGKIPYSFNAITFSIDDYMYSYKDGNILIQGINKGKRIAIKLTDKNQYNGTLKVKIIDDSLEIHKPLKIKTKKHEDYNNIIGIDKGYKYLFAVSSEKFYGEKLNTFLSKETERLNTVNQNRNRFYALYNQYVEQGNTKKANTIKENNLGKIKYNKHKQIHDEQVKSYINHSLNQLFINEKPCEIVMENLDFVSWKDKYPKSIKRKLSRWIKGYIRERLEYKSDLNEVKYRYINPAYTSKVCNVCGSFGKRNGDVFTCPKCGNSHADINASKNILNRKNDKKITLYTKFTKVKEILENRLS